MCMCVCVCVCVCIVRTDRVPAEFAKNVETVQYTVHRHTFTHQTFFSCGFLSRETIVVIPTLILA